MMDRLITYRWPGNVREMRNLFERLHLMTTDGRLTLADLPSGFHTDVPVAPVAAPDPTPIPPSSLTDMEEQAIRRALVAEAGNLTRVATTLGISRPTLYRKLKSYGIRRTYE